MIWTSDQLLERLQLGEDSRVEFKEAFFRGDAVEAPKRKDIANELAAFGNGGGGTLIFSVSDGRKVQALSPEQMDALEGFVSEVCADNIRPPLAFTTQRLAVPMHGAVLVVEVDQSTTVHKSPGGYFHRQGSSKRELPSQALQQLFQRRGRSGLLAPDEAIIEGTGRNTLGELADRFTSSRTTEPRDSQLAKLGVLRDDDAGIGRATIAGVLLCTERPDEFIPGAVIEAVRFDGTVLGNASQLDAATISGPIDRQIREAVTFAKRNTRVQARKVPGRVEIPQYSPRAVFEAVVNAVVHRDYSMEHARIRLFIFDDRLELYSPGALPNTLPIEAMRYRQVTRNETIASLLRMLAVGEIHGSGERQYFMEQRGEGIPTIYEQTSGLAGQDPTYELIGETELRLTMPPAHPPVERIEGNVSVSADGRPLAGAQVVAIYPNKTRMEATSDTFGRARFDFFTSLPITVFCAAPNHGAFVARDWRPPEPLSIQLAELPTGGSVVFLEGTGHLPRLSGRLNPILDSLDRMYLYANNIAIDEGKTQPVQFSLKQPLRLTDVYGSELIVRFVEMLGKSALVEYSPPETEFSSVAE